MPASSKTPLPFVAALPRFGAYVTVRENVPVDDDEFLRFVPYDGDEEAYEFFQAVYEDSNVDTQDEEVVRTLAMYEFEDVVLEGVLRDAGQEQDLELILHAFQRKLKEVEGKDGIGFRCRKLGRAREVDGDVAPTTLAEAREKVDLLKRGITETFPERVRRCLGNLDKAALPYGLAHLNPSKPPLPLKTTTDTSPALAALRRPLPESLDGEAIIQCDMDIMDTWRTLFCRLCYTYDCVHHPRRDPSPKYLTYLFQLQVETVAASPQWLTPPTTPCGAQCFSVTGVSAVAKCRPSSARSPSKSSAASPTTAPVVWTKTVLACRGSCCTAARILNQPCHAIRAGVSRHFAAIQRFTREVQPILASTSTITTARPAWIANVADVRSTTSNKKLTKHERPKCPGPAEGGFPPDTTTTRLVSLLRDSYKAQEKIMSNCRISRRLVADTTRGGFRDPAVVPCEHPGPCTEANCSCLATFNYCTKHCSCCTDVNFGFSHYMCRSLFPGCQCEGKDDLDTCAGKRCSCFLAARECDRDLCTPYCHASVACPDKCGNFSLQGQQSCHVLASDSGVAGLGVFAAHDIPEGRVVKEYTGEIVSQGEADRRGVYYDQVNRSYLFSVDTEQVVDAFRRGNKIKFANHAGGGQANCVAKIVNVDRCPRICICSKRLIKAGEELFFDYAYDAERKGRDYIQNAIVPSWFNRSSASSASDAGASASAARGASFRSSGGRKTTTGGKRRITSTARSASAGGDGGDEAAAAKEEDMSSSANKRARRLHGRG